MKGKVPRELREETEKNLVETVKNITVEIVEDKPVNTGANVECVDLKYDRSESKNSPQKFSKLGDKIPETQNEANVQISIKSEIDTQSGGNFSKRVTDPCGSHKTEFKDELCLSILAVNTDAHIHSSQSINPKISRVSDDSVHHIQAKISSNGGLFLSSDTDRNHIYLEKKRSF